MKQQILQQQLDEANLKLSEFSECVNGFTSWKETYYAVVAAITRAEGDSNYIVDSIWAKEGVRGICNLATALTNEFERLHQAREFGKFMYEKLYKP